MRPRLLELLRCPVCSGSFAMEAFRKESDEIIDGILICGCGLKYPIVNTIARILPDVFNDYPEFLKNYRSQLQAVKADAQDKKTAFYFNKSAQKTQRSFGFQWSVFSEMTDTFRENFLNYIYPIGPEFFKGKLCLDAGCGFGRHIYNAAKFGAEMVGIDVSKAIDSTYKNTKDFKNVHLVQCDICHLPFKENIFDFIYSIGVLHHMADPRIGFRSLLPFLKSRSSISIWVYSKKRKVTNFVLEGARFFTTQMPYPVLYRISFLCAAIDWFLFIRPYMLAKDILLFKKVVEKITFSRIKNYSKYPFQVSYADWFDRLSAPIRFYYDEKELENWLEEANLKNIKVSSTGYYGLRAYGERH